MSAIDIGQEARDRVVDEALNLVDNLEVDQARSILRCFVIDEENFDPHALAIIELTVRAISERSLSDYNALIHFPDSKTAKLNREFLLESRAASAEAETGVQEAAEQSRASVPPSRTLADISNIESRTDDGRHDQQRAQAAATPSPDLDDLEFEKLETRRLIRDGHVTINHYCMNKAPEVPPAPEPKPAPAPAPAPVPAQAPAPVPAPKPKPPPEPEPEPEWILCYCCEEYYLEKDNVLDENGRPPCGYHTGRVINYGNNLLWAERNYGVRVTGRAWNCCRRRPDAAGCHPEFHEPEDSSDID